MKSTFRYFVPITLIAMVLSWISGKVALAFGVELPQQTLVQLLRSPNVAGLVKVKWGALAVLVCPPVEELVFRMGLFNGLQWLFRRLNPNLKPKPQFLAALVSALVFASAHLQPTWGGWLATFVPLTFLGYAFAWLYRRAGTILAPMACHVFFNAVNLVLCLAFPT